MAAFRALRMTKEASEKADAEKADAEKAGAKKIAATIKKTPNLPRAHRR